MWFDCRRFAPWTLIAVRSNLYGVEFICAHLQALHKWVWTIQHNNEIHVQPNVFLIAFLRANGWHCVKIFTIWSLSIDNYDFLKVFSNVFSGYFTQFFSQVNCIINNIAWNMQCWLIAYMTVQCQSCIVNLSAVSQRRQLSDIVIRGERKNAQNINEHNIW